MARRFFHAANPLIRIMVLAMPFIVASCSETPKTSPQAGGLCWPQTELPETSTVNGEFQIVSHTAALPDAVIEMLPSMADPEGDFNATDVVDPSLPRYRLTFGGYAEDKAFVYFEQGGFVLAQCLVVFQVQDDLATIISSAPVRGGATNLEQLREIVD